MKASEAFDSTNARETTSYQNELISRGELGQIAFGLFRAQKRSARAKAYRRGFKQESYAAKNEALKYLDVALTLWGARLNIPWGWQKDDGQEYHNQVLYVELPSGQCSFHSQAAASKKSFTGKWSGKHDSREVILAFCDHVFEQETPRELVADDLMMFGYTVGTKLGELGEKNVTGLLAWNGIDSWPALHSYLKQVPKQVAV